MKKFILAFAILFCSAPAWAAIAYRATSGTLCNQTTASAGVACTLTGSTSAGSVVVVGLSWKTTTRSINKIVGSASASYAFTYAQGCNGSGTCSAIAICIDCAAITTVTPTFTGTTLYTLSVAEYTGVSWVGFTSPVATATSTAPAVTMTTGDANDWIVVELSALATGGIPTSNTGNLRQANRTGTTSSNVAGALCDNTVASAGSVTCQVTITSVAWDAIGVELRTTAPKTYIWPDCDSTHPCIVHEKDTNTLAIAGDPLVSPLKVTVPPTGAGNVINLSITFPDPSGTPAITLTTPTDDKSNTWVAGASTDDTSNHTITKNYHVCAPTTGTSVININWTGTMSSSPVGGFRYDEMSGLSSTCYDTGSGANGVQGAIGPGSFTTTVNGDMILTAAVNASTSTENSSDAGMIMPDDVDTMTAANVFQQFMYMEFVQGTHGATNPTVSANAQDPNNIGGLYFNIVSDAFFASSGAGTQPSSIQVVLDQAYYGTNATGTVVWNPLPSEGNALVVASSNPITGFSMSGFGSNIGETYTAISHVSATTDPQIYSTCLGAAATQRDRIVSFPIATNEVHMEFYTIAGAKTSSGTGCVGATINNQTGTQAAVNNSNVVGDPVFTPTINSGANSVVISTSYVGEGPPQAMCISGGVTPPSCTGQSAGVIFNSIWGSGMADTSGFSTGDPYVFYYTNSTSSKSLDYLMANAVSSPGGGTALDGAAIEIEGVAQTYSLPNNNAGCPASCLVIPWQTGSDLWNSGTLPVYGQVTCTPLHEDGTTDDTADVNACITAANSGTGSYATCHAAGGCAVYIPAGNVMIKGTVTLKSNVVLRGAGPTTVITEGNAAAQITTNNFSHSVNLNPATSYQTFPSTFLLSGTPQKGDTSVTCSTGCANVSVGTWIKIFGNDDPSLISDSMQDSGSYYKCDMCGDNDGYYIMQQYEQVTACSPGCPSGSSSGTVWTISRPLYYPPYTTSVTVYNTSGGTQVEPAGAKFNVIQFQTTKAGLEYLQVNATADLGANQNILYQGCLYCWVKGVEVVLSGSNQLSAMFESDWGYGGEIRDSYFHDQRSGASGAGYGIYFQFPNGDMKVENNIVRHSRHPIIFQGGVDGIAILYNYTDDAYTDDLTYLGSARMNHGAHNYMVLWEGNVMSHLTSDDCWGSSSHQVAFRNWLWGDETMNWTTPSGAAATPTGSDPGNGFDAIDLYTGQVYYSFVGNVLGHASLHTTWSGATVGPTNNAYGTRTAPVVYSEAGAVGAGNGTCDDIVDSTIPSTSATTLLHGNWDYKTNGVAYWNGGANHTLAASIYYPSGQPSFLAGTPWPLEGPENSPTINNNPAYTCWLSGPATGGAFNPASCYAASILTPATPTLMSTLF